MGETEVRALDGVTLQVQPGEYCAIMGASGSGKSTAMNVIGCLDRPTTGTYLLDGTDVAQLDDPQLAAVRNQKIGFVFQQYFLLPHLNALENVMLPLTYAQVSRAERQERAKAALDRVQMGHRLRNRPHELSGGQQQRVAIARALVHRPQLVLADEPTAALDKKTGREVVEMMQRLVKEAGTTILMVTHDNRILDIADRLIELVDGTIERDREGIAKGEIFML
ncbi:MAG TPA: macrolide ABC transporter ATP-binding protein [Cyanobacteria bacterium UBA8156]|nr:macrolide ABC transporter ATP-binding protein [Cyanobacteria bacterium UBA8156]